MERIQRILKPEVRAVNETDRTIEFVISSEERDTYGTVFKMDGWNLTRYALNPIVTYQHDDFSSNPDMVIGTSEISFEDRKMIGKLRFEDWTVTKNEVAEKVFRKVQAGTLNMASIMAEVSDGHWGDRSAGEDPETFYFTNQELFSWSIVTHGSNPAALKRSAEESFIESKKKNRVSFDDARLFTIKTKFK